MLRAGSFRSAIRVGRSVATTTPVWTGGNPDVGAAELHVGLEPPPAFREVRRDAQHVAVRGESEHAVHECPPCAAHRRGVQLRSLGGKVELGTEMQPFQGVLCTSKTSERDRVRAR